MSEDSELLELAAKAAGIGPVLRFQAGGLIIGPNRHSRYWNPLNDDGDALRLAIKLSLRVECYTGAKLFPKYGEINITDVYSFDEKIALSELHNDDPTAATRRAIVRAAAEIGRAMQ